MRILAKMSGYYKKTWKVSTCTCMFMHVCACIYINKRCMHVGKLKFNLLKLQKKIKKRD